MKALTSYETIVLAFLSRHPCVVVCIYCVLEYHPLQFRAVLCL
jgi:hypothetical protein